MPLYEVTLHETVEYVRTIEADSAEEAGDKACQEWEETEDPESLHTFRGCGVDAVHVKEVDE